MTDLAHITAPDPAAAEPAAEPGRAARPARLALSAGDPILAAKLTVPDLPGWAVPPTFALRSARGRAVAAPTPCVLGDGVP
jgi:hypothetical protein